MDQERLKELLEYDPLTGVFTWLVTKGSNAKKGSRAGGLNKLSGYRMVMLDGVSYFESRLAWLYIKGEWPIGIVDHRNRVRSDNRFKNLRDVSQIINMQNAGAHGGNSSGVPGVSWSKSKGKWVANIRIEGKKKHIGYFSGLVAAGKAYERAKMKFHTQG